jgi:hypothetical protein
MTALPSIHALCAIHDAFASIHQKQGGLSKTNRPCFFMCGVIYLTYKVKEGA